MYIVQVRNPQRYTWKEPECVQTRFRSITKAKAMRDALLANPNFWPLEVRVWQPAAEHEVEFDAD